jgi:hypothetical protein
MEDIETKLASLIEVAKKFSDDLKELQKIAKKATPKEKKPKAKKKEETPETKEKSSAKEDTSEEEEAPKEKKPKTKKKEETPAKVEEAPKEKAEKRFTRMSGPTLKAFEKAMGDKMSAEHKKQFADYVNKMDADTFAGMSIEKHMETYAGSLNPKVLTVIQLRAHKKDLTEISAGVYRTKTGELVTGPPELEDEEFDDGEFEGKSLIIGQTTTRVYARKDDGPDGPFLGYWGVADFYEADL